MTKNKMYFCLLCSLFFVASVSTNAESQKDANIRKAVRKLAVPKCGIPFAAYQHPIAGPKTYSLFKWTFKAKKPETEPIAELRAIDNKGLVELTLLNSKFKLKDLTPSTANELFGPWPNNLSRKQQTYRFSTKNHNWVIIALYFEKGVLEKYHVKGTLGNSIFVKVE